MKEERRPSSRQLLRFSLDDLVRASAPISTVLEAFDWHPLHQECRSKYKALASIVQSEWERELSISKRYLSLLVQQAVRHAESIHREEEVSEELMSIWAIMLVSPY